MTRRNCSVRRLKDAPLFTFARLKVRDLARREHIPNASILEVTLPPRYQHQPILHRKTREWILVLSGRGQGIIGGRTVRFRPGSIVYIPPKVPHQMSTGSSRLRVMVLFTPPMDLRSKNADMHHPS